MLPHFGRQANWTPVWYMAVGQSPLSRWIQVAGAQELLWTGCYALAAENYSFGQESRPNGLILLIQPKRLHTAALSFTAREEDWVRERRKRDRVGNSWGQLDWASLKDPEGCFLCKKGKKKKKQLRPILDIKLYFWLCCVWNVGNHTKSLRVVFFEWLGTLLQNYNQRGKMVMYSGPRCVSPCSIFLRGNPCTIGSLIFIHIAWVLLISSSFSIKERMDILHKLLWLSWSHGRSQRRKEQTLQELLVSGGQANVQFNRWIIFRWIPNTCSSQNSKNTKEHRLYRYTNLQLWLRYTALRLLINHSGPESLTHCKWRKQCRQTKK